LLQLHEVSSRCPGHVMQGVLRASGPWPSDI